MNLSDKQSWLLSRANNCPVKKSIEECDIKEYRSMPIDKRQVLIYQMRREAIDGTFEMCW